MKCNIVMKLHQDKGVKYLDCQDVYEYITENTEEEVEIAHYIDMWCKYLNYYVAESHNKEMMFGDVEYTRIKSWIEGYTYAKKYRVSKYENKVEIKAGKYLITLMQPSKGDIDLYK